MLDSNAAALLDRLIVFASEHDVCFEFLFKNSSGILIGFLEFRQTAPIVRLASMKRPGLIAPTTTTTNDGGAR